MSAPDRPRSEARLAWADAAKGLAIALVVLYHVIGKHFDELVPADLGAVATTWLAIGYALRPLRMPLFFVLSGMFAARALERPWGRVLGPRVLGLYYLYAVWLVVHFAIFTRARELPMNRTRDLGELLADLAFASTSLWYLYALAVYFLLLRLLRRVPTGWVVGGALALALVAAAYPLDQVNRSSVLQHLVFFAVGARCPDLVRRVSRLRPRRALLPLVAAYVGLGALGLGVGLGADLTKLLASLAAIPLGIVAVVALGRWPRISTATAWFGRRTLPVYVLHVPLLSVVVHLPLVWSAWPPAGPLAPWQVVVLAVQPLVVTAAIIAVALVLNAVAPRVGLGWLFGVPGWLRRPRGRAARGQAARDQAAGESSSPASSLGSSSISGRSGSTDR